MPPKKQPMNQLQIHVPHFGRFVDPEQEYAQELGADALERQKALYEEANRCKCGTGHERRGPRWHKQGCPRRSARAA
jgi:hypothetical protein